MNRINILELLEELKEFTFKEGQVYEVLRPIYPKEPKINVIKYKSMYFTKPLGVDKKTKKNILKEGDDIKDFFKDFSRGDLIKINKIDSNGKIAECENMTLKENIKEQYYKDGFIIENSYLTDGSLKLIKRGAKKLIASQSEDSEVLSKAKKEGKYKGQKLEYDPVELEIGIQVEHEHFNKNTLSKQIALDHLAEKRNYYTELSSIDNDCKKIAERVLKKHGYSSIEEYKNEK